jgi:hypothetical protein
VTGTPTYTLGFYNPEYGAYTWILGEDVEEYVRDEVKQSVSDAGSDGYELIFADDEPIDTDDEDAATAAVMEAHERGINAAADRHVAEIMAKFQPVLAGRTTLADAKLPHGGIRIYLAEEEE